jgi:NAD+ kinase
MKRVLVVYKKSFLESHAADRTLLGRLPARQRVRYVRSDGANRATIQAVVEFLRHKAKVTLVDRASLARNPRYDLIVTIGGDGTFFAASHHVGSTPVIAVNSDPTNSLGLFACCDRENFSAPLARAIDHELPVLKLNRLSVTINREKVRELVVNDLLFAHRNAAAMSHYEFAAGGPGEVQRSSGIWIANAGGSTAGIRAAGGTRMPIDSRRIQWLVREPYGWPYPRYRLLRGMAQRSIDLLVLMGEAGLWLDGSRLRYDLALGDRVTIRTGAAPLHLLGYDDARRCRLFP